MGYHYSILVVAKWVFACKGWDSISGKDSVPGGRGGGVPYSIGDFLSLKV